MILFATLRLGRLGLIHGQNVGRLRCTITLIILHVVELVEIGLRYLEGTMGHMRSIKQKQRLLLLLGLIMTLGVRVVVSIDNIEHASLKNKFFVIGPRQLAGRTIGIPQIYNFVWWRRTIFIS